MTVLAIGLICLPFVLAGIFGTTGVDLIEKITRGHWKIH